MSHLIRNSMFVCIALYASISFSAIQPFYAQKCVKGSQVRIIKEVNGSSQKSCQVNQERILKGGKSTITLFKGSKPAGVSVGTISERRNIFRMAVQGASVDAFPASMSALTGAGCAAQSAGAMNNSPAIFWSGPLPAGTTSLALIATDLSGASGISTTSLGETLMVAYNINPARGSLASNELKNGSANFRGGLNSFGTQVWRGPCPENNRSSHAIHFFLIATSIPLGELSAGLTEVQLRAAISAGARGKGSDTYISEFIKDKSYPVADRYKMVMPDLVKKGMIPIEYVAAFKRSAAATSATTPFGVSWSNATSVPACNTAPVGALGHSPLITWNPAKLPAGTQQLIIQAVDTGTTGSASILQFGVTHTLAYNINPALGSIAKNELVTTTDGVSPSSANFRAGKNFFGQNFYHGPCPPNAPMHEYVFTMIASSQPLGTISGPGTFTVDPVTDIFTQIAHGYPTGRVVQVLSTNTLPATNILSPALVALGTFPLYDATDYFVISIDVDHYKLAKNLANATAMTPIPMDITSAGLGIHTATPALSRATLMPLLAGTGLGAWTYDVKYIRDPKVNNPHILYLNNAMKFNDAPNLAIGAQGGEIKVFGIAEDANKEIYMLGNRYSFANSVNGKRRNAAVIMKVVKTCTVGALCIKP